MINQLLEVGMESLLKELTQELKEMHHVTRDQIDKANLSVNQHSARKIMSTFDYLILGYDTIECAYCLMRQHECQLDFSALSVKKKNSRTLKSNTAKQFNRQ